MQLIDDEGRIFGLVNVVDALVVLLVLAVVVAGIALVDPFGDAGGEEATRYATLDLGEQRPVVAEQIDEGDVMSPRGTSKNLTVTDVHVTPGSGENVSVTVRVEAEGQLVRNDQRDGSVFSFAGETMRQGSAFRINTGEYEASGTVTNLTESAPELQRGSTSVTVEANVSSSVASSISTGDAYEVGGSTVAEITDVHVGPGSDGDTRNVVLGMALTTLGGDDATFAGGPVTVGRSIAFENGAYALSGQVTRVGNASVETATSRVTLRATLGTDTADSISPGDAYRLGDDRVGTVTDIRVFPGPNPDQRTVILGAELTTVTRTDGQYFGGTRIATGQTVSFRGDGYTFGARIQESGTSSVETVETDVVVETTASAETADTVAVGDEYRIAGETLATVQSLEIYPTGDATTRQIVMGLRLQTVQRDGTNRFGTAPVRLGATVPFETDSYALDATIQQRGTTTIEVTDTEVVIETTTSAAVADAITVGDEYSVAGETVGTVQTLSVYPTADEDTKRVVMGLRLRTLQRDGQLQFGTQPVRIGSTIAFDGDGYTLSGSIINQGTLTPPGDQATRTITVKLANVPPEFADGLSEGLVERQRGTTTATVTDVRVEPAVITLTSDSGDIFRREHPVNKDVYLTVEVTARETASGLRFHGQALREGSSVTLDFSTITAEGTVIDVGNATSGSLRPMGAFHVESVTVER